jgi:hypothetical protein
LQAFCADPDFDAGERAFYYVRVIEIPTPRWTAYVALRFGIEMSPELADLVHAMNYNVHSLEPGFDP